MKKYWRDGRKQAEIKPEVLGVDKPERHELHLTRALNHTAKQCPICERPLKTTRTVNVDIYGMSAIYAVPCGCYLCLISGDET